jgi:hypothetical protein
MKWTSSSGSTNPSSAAIAALDPDGHDFGSGVHDMLRDLDEHVERENLGISRCPW